jgi:alpha-amylase
VAIVGSIPELGEWDPENCVFLETSATTFPNWTAKMNLPRLESIEYKFIIVQQSHIIQIKERPVNQLGHVQKPIP